VQLPLLLLLQQLPRPKLSEKNKKDWNKREHPNLKSKENKRKLNASV